MKLDMLHSLTILFLQVDDILCTKKYCAFIYLQSIMIDTVSDFRVGKDTITSAACEEVSTNIRFCPTVAHPGTLNWRIGALRSW